jgi:hypothetical protein
MLKVVFRAIGQIVKLKTSVRKAQTVFLIQNEGKAIAVVGIYWATYYSS